MPIEASSRISELLESIDYATFEVDQDGLLTGVNSVFCRWAGYPVEEVLSLHFRQFLERDHVPGIQQVFEQVLETGQAQRGIPFTLRTRDGRLNFVEGAVSLVTTGDGRKGLQGVLHDAGEHRQAEETMNQAKQAYERELEIGRRIQASFLPCELPQPAGWEIVSRFEAARMVAGDFYDAFTLSGGKRIGLVIADVCDKGVGAALFMALFRSLIRAFADQHYSLGWMDVLSGERSTSTQDGSVGRRRELLSTGTTALKNAIDLTNNYIARNHGDTNMFATMFFGILDPNRGSLIYINGGHEPPILIGPQGIKAQLEPTGPAVGLWPNLEFGIKQVEIEPGDILLTYTDGVIDARNPDGESFSEERLFALAQQPAPSAEALLEHIQSDLSAHIAGIAQYDDITMLAVRRVQ